MNAKRLLGALLTAGLSLAMVTGAADVAAQRKKPDAPQTEAPTTKTAIKVTLAGISFGMSPKQVADAIDKVLDDDYRPLYKEVQPGIRMKELDAQLAEEKSTFRRSRIDFGKLPTGVDASPLRGEYTYQNREAMMIFNRKGQVHNLFFIQERLWKIIDEHKLSDTHVLGKSYPDAVVKLSTTYGVPGRVITPDATHFAVEVDWKDATTHMRAIQRGDAALGIAYEDNGTLANLGSLRSFKAAVDDGIDPDVAAAMRGKSPDPGPPPDPKKKK
jgi:hypothetical protein